MADVLLRRLDWLKTQASGGPASRRVTLHDLADDGRTEDRIRQGYTGRAPMELVQNAHDALADAGERGRVYLTVTSTALLVANHGKPFDVDRITSLTRLGSSDKKKRRTTHHQIGYKGIGFTSVFEVSDRPQILSRDVGFVFDRSAAARLVEEYLGAGLDGPVPARYFPLALEDGELGEDEPRIARLFADGAATVVRLPFRADRSRDEVITAVRETLVPEILLFLPAVDAFSLDDGDQATTWERHDGTRSGVGRIIHLESDLGERRSWLLAAGSTPVDTEVVRALNDELWKGVRRLNVAVAIPWSDRGPRDVPPATHLHSYFPTDDRLGRGLLVHGDFYLDATRRRVELNGPHGAVSETVLAAAATLGADLVASVARWGRPLLRLCAPEGGADGAGERFGKLFESALSTRPIGRTVSGGDARTPEEMVRLGLDLDVEVTSKLARCLDPDDDVLDPRDDVAETRRLFERLGSKRLGPTEVAARVNLAKADLAYSPGLVLLGQWLATTEWQRYQVVAVLRGRRVVQDESDEWVTPDSIERRAEGAPDLPEALRRATMLEPTTSGARAVVDTLGITVLDHETALSRLLDAVQAGEFGTTNAEREQALELAWRIWRSKPGAITGEAHRVGVLEVTTRTARAKRERWWRRADQTYLGANALGDRTLEQLYAALGEPEFLAEPFVGSNRERQQRIAFFRALGVGAAPRRVGIDWFRAKQFHAWQYGDGRGTAWDCVNDHPQSGRDVDGWMIDRLDEILASVDDPDTAAALAHGLAALDEPFGPREVHVRCQHSGHGGRAVAKPVIGYQRWRLETTPWIPVANDPTGAALQVPSRAWRGLPRKSPWLMIPRARLRDADADALDLVSAERPTAEAAEAALETLAEKYPDLETAPTEVRDTADWLLRRLERVLVRGDKRRASSPPLPTQAPSGATWSREAVVPNIPGLPLLPGIHLLPVGRWPGVQRAYALPLARDRITAVIRAGVRRQVPHLLDVPLRIHLLAILVRRGADSERTAARLAAIRERPVAALSVAWRVDEVSTPAPDARFVLEPDCDKRGRVIRAELIWTADRRPDHVELGRALAEHLELPDDDSEIALFLSNPRHLVDQRGLTQGELDDAGRLLRSRRYFRDTPATQSSRSTGGLAALDPTAWQPPADDEPLRTPSADRPIKDYVDPSGVTFGKPERLTPPEPSMGGSGGGRDQGSRATAAPAAQLSRQIAPAAPEVVGATASGKRTEETAVSIVIRYGQGLPEVERIDDVQDADRGWDLEFHLRDGRMIPVEVKGSSGSGPFVLTANELNAARAHPDFILYHVVDLTSPTKTRMRVYERLGERLTDEMVSAAGWAVTGWRDLAPLEIPASSLERGRAV